MDRLRFTILGCGSSPGTPRPTGDWGNCDPANPRNRRMRAAALLERIRPDGERTIVVIDTGPDFRSQMLLASVRHIDAVIYTHPHADHIHGIDDLRSYVLEQRKRIPIYADKPTYARIEQGFGYIFKTPEGSSYPAILEHVPIDHARGFEVNGAGGSIPIQPLPLIHGDIVSLGFRIGPLAYCTDVSAFPATTRPLLRDLEWLIIDALQYDTHPSHFSLSEALAEIREIKPAHAVLTHMHVPLDYETVLGETPAYVEPGYDGMVIEFDWPAVNR